MLHRRSVMLWLALLVGMSVLLPWLAWSILPGAVLVIWIRHRYPPGSIHKTIRARLLTWLYLLAHLRWLGYGAGSTRLACEAAHLRSGGLAMDGGPARNELVQVVYEWGMPGLLVCGFLGWRLVSTLRVGDPLSAALVTGLMLACGTSVLRTRWGLPWWGLALWRMI